MNTNRTPSATLYRVFFLAWSLLATVWLSGHGGAQGAATETLTFSSFADVYVDASDPTANFGSHDRLWADASPERMTYLRFVVTGVAGRPVLTARLRLHVSGRSKTGGTIRPIHDPSWDEATITFANRPIADDPPLAALGAVEVDEVVEIALDGTVTGDGTYDFVIDSTSSDGVHYVSSEASSGEGPLLILTLSSAPEPIVTILQPPDGATFFRGDLVPLQAMALDELDGRLDDDIEWTSDRDGPLGQGAILAPVLSEGSHAITASVVDSDGLTGADQIDITVSPPPADNTAPLVAITSPLDDQVFSASDAVSFGGTATDLEDGTLSGQLSWTSDQDGHIGDGASFTTLLSEGPHDVTASVSDSGGLVGAATVRFEVMTTTDLGFGAIADAYVDENAPSTNFGSSTELLADATAERITYLRFAVTGIDHRHVLRARVQMTVASNTSASSDRGGVMYAMSPGAWGEATVTYGTLPDIDGQRLASVAAVSSGDVVTFDVTDAVTADGSYDFALISESADGVAYRSRESSSGRPRLVVSVDNNAPPVVEIRFPASTIDIPVDSAVIFEGTATDPEDGNLSDAIAWRSDLDGPLGSGNRLTASLSPGRHSITASVRDSEDVEGQAQVAVNVGNAPVVTIQAPADGTMLSASDPRVALRGEAKDAEDGRLRDDIEWSSDLDGYLGRGHRITVTLGTGQHRISAAVTDSDGLRGEATIGVVVRGANQVPQVTISSPADGSELPAGSAIVFAGYAVDDFDQNLGPAITWRSDRDGALGTGASLSRVLSEGDHHITASVKDSDGATGTDDIRITVTPTAPTVTILEPFDGKTVAIGEPVTFHGQASDPTDGDLSSALRWTSDLDGLIGTGGSVTTTALAQGVHQIAATVADAGDRMGTDRITVNVAPPSAPPVVTIVEPAGGAVFGVGQPVELGATADDPEDGSITSSLRWTSNRNGFIGTGGHVITDALSSGTHVITAVATDSTGVSASDSVTIEIVTGIPVVHILLPAPQAGFLTTTAVQFYATADDVIDGDVSAGLVWASDRDGVIGTGQTFAVDTLSTGTHTVSAVVTTARGTTGTARATFVVSPPTVAVSATADAYVDEALPDTNFGADSKLMADAGPSVREAYLRFDVTGIAGLDVALARLQMKVADKGNSDSGGTFHLFSGQGWNESTVTFSSKPVIDGPVVGTVDRDVAPGDLVEVDLTSTVVGEGSYHLALVTSSTDAVRYSSREAGGQQPQLYLQLAEPAVEHPPGLSIVSPVPGASVFDDTPVAFTAAASDVEDGDLSDGVVWTSDRDGLVGSGASLNAVLSRGTHAITASVADSFGLVTRAAVTVIVTDRPPTVTITTPTMHELFPVGFPVSLEATALDGEEGDLSAEVEWMSQRDGPLGVGGTVVTAGLTAGDHVITATVANQLGTAAADAVTIFVGQAPPQVMITAPVTSVTIGEGTPLALAGSATDLEDGNLSAVLDWSSDLEGALGTGASLGVALLVNGTHTITASATDSHGFTRSDQVAVTVTPAPPAVTITTPADGTDVTGPISFSATAFDVRDGDRSAGIEWTSSVDGLLGTGAMLPSLELSPGVHVITATATDVDGLVGADAVTVVVGVAVPDVEIVEPVSSAGPLSQTTVEPGVPVTFTARAFDVFGQDMSPSVVWSSDLSGVLGTGASLVVVDLLTGRHVISAAATDVHGITGSARIVVLVTDAGGAGGPTVTVTAPSADTILQVGSPALFEAAASDGTGNDLSDGITWVSNLDGLVGQGETVTAALRSVGTHVITAAVADQTGIVGTAALTIEAVLPFASFDAAADAYVDHAAPDTNLGAAPELLVGTDPTRRIYLRFDADGLTGRTVEHAVVRLRTTSNGDAGSADGGVIHAVHATWDELTLTHSTSPAIDTPPLDAAGEVLPSQVVDFDVTAAIGGDGSYGFAIVPGADEAIYRSREGAFGAPQLIVSFKAPVFQHPHVQLLAPADLATLPAATPATFRGTAYDEQDGDLDVAIIWRSSIDGLLAIGPEVSLQLSPGSHVVMATVNDVDGNPSADAIHVFVGDRPIVTIDLPADGASVEFGEPLFFGGTAFDPQDGELSAFLEWTSDIDGPLAVGPSLARALSPGTHSISAQVTDADGHVGRAIISVTVRADDVGFRDFDFGPGVDQDNNRVTASKPESKLWYIDGIWWATLFSPTSSAYTIHRLDIATQTWLDTHVVIDERPQSRQDVLLDGDTLYVLSRTSDPTGENHLLRYVYHPDVQIFVIDPGFPVNIPGAGTESMTIAKDSTGRLWGAFTLNDSVMVTHSLGSDAEWAAPFIVPVADEDPDAAAVWFDDIAAIQAIDDGIGVFWSNQLTKEDYFAVHRDGTALDDPSAWHLEIAATGGSIADDHFNLKLASDGRLFVAVKTSFSSAAATLVGLLVRSPEGSWSELYRVTTAEYSPTRPICLLDETRRRVHVYYSPFEGAIYTKSSDMDTIAFLDDGIGRPFITSGSTGVINNPTGTKQNVDAETGLVVLAASKTAYWHNSIDPAPAPVVTITAPGDDVAIRHGTVVAFDATAFSLADGIVTDRLAWTSSIDGMLGVGGSFSRSDLSTGEHLVTASVTDSTRVTGRAQVRIRIEEDAAPVVTIETPTAQEKFLAGTAITLAGLAMDSLDGDLSTTLQWSSDRDGVLGTGATVTVGSMSLGTHVITARASDSAGLTGSASVTIDVQQLDPPTVQITSPASGATFAFGSAVTFSGIATDAFDGDLGASLRWTSDRDGAIGTGASFSRSSLSAGVHAITATATDSHGLSHSATITVTVGNL
jgi:hypothetical protein